MSAVLHVTTHRAGDGTVELSAVGELDLSTVERFEAALGEAVTEAGPNPVTLDLRGVEYLDSAAINVLFNHADRIRRIRIHRLLQRTLSISGLDQIVDVESADSY